MIESFESPGALRAHLGEHGNEPPEGVPVEVMERIHAEAHALTEEIVIGDPTDLAAIQDAIGRRFEELAAMARDTRLPKKAHEGVLQAQTELQNAWQKIRGA